MIRKKGVRVKPHSLAEIHAWAKKIRNAYSPRGEYYFPVVEFLENEMKKHFPLFEYEYAEKAVMGSVEGLTIPEINTIRIREDVCEAAVRHDGRARFTIAHEIGHYVLHRNQSLGYSRGRASEHKIFEDSEWQADSLASELLMPSHLIRGMTVIQVTK